MGPLSACACGWTLKKERRHCLGTAGTLLCKVATKEELPGKEEVANWEPCEEYSTNISAMEISEFSCDELNPYKI